MYYIFQEQEEKAKPKPIAFTISPETLTNIKEVTIVTKILISAFLGGVMSGWFQ